MTIRIAAFYRFVPLDDVESLVEPVRETLVQHNILGTVLLAHEGINGTIAGTLDDIEAVFAWFRTLPGLAGLTYQPTEASYRPFLKLRVRLKNEIVTIRTETDPRSRVGEYVDPKRWNELLDDPNVVVLDTRNHHEVAVGTFQGAIDPMTRSFGEFPAYVEQNLDPEQPIAMFCTGGIRCEKATSLLLARGFKKVYHLEGGILRYLRETPISESKWQGECFIFDQRMTLDHNLQPRYDSPEEGRAHLVDGWPSSPA